MKNNLISASLCTQSLIFRLTEPPASFEITVNNDSDRFANFQLEIEAAGEKRSSEYRWYRLEPEIAAAQPHGSSLNSKCLFLTHPFLDLSVRLISLSKYFHLN